MNLAFIGDIHSNYIALEKCLTYCKDNNIDGYVFLGDYISDCPDPQRTLALLREIKASYPTWFLLGNREEYQLDYLEGKITDWKYSSNSGSLLYTFENLTPEDFEFFRQCKLTEKLSLPDYPEITICHGSPKSTRELLHPGSQRAKTYIRQCRTPYLVCAHTHIQSIYEAYGKYLINPGAVGLPIASEGKLQFAIFHGKTGKWEPELVSLEYDVEGLIEEYNKSDLVQKCNVFAKVIWQELRTGKNYLPMMINKTMELTLEGEGVVNLQDMPERYWEEAYHIIFGQLKS